MKTLIFIIAILFILSAAFVGFMNKTKHTELTQKTYDKLKLNDQLEIEIDGKEGDNLDLANYKDDGDTPVGKTEDDKLRNAIGLIKQRAIVGNSEPMKFSSETTNSKYERKHNDDTLVFTQFNKMNLDEDSQKANKKQLAFISEEAVDVITGQALVENTDDLKGTLDLYIEKTLGGQITLLNDEVNATSSNKSELESEIKEYVDAEKRISNMFSAEGINDLQGGKDKLKQLEQTRKELLDKQDVLEKESEALTEKKDKNIDKLATQTDYFAKRKVSIGGNGKKYKVVASDFDWGFVVIHAHEVQNFFVNQDLLVFRRGKYIGKVKVSSVEPGRVMADVNYDSVTPGIIFRKGDMVAPANTIDR